LVVRHETARGDSPRPELQERKSAAAIVEPWRGGQRRLPMDILACMFAYLVSVAGILAGLAMGLMVFFSAPAQQSTAPRHAVALTAQPSRHDAARSAPVKTVAALERAPQQTASIAATAVPPRTIAIDARQKPLFSPARLRRLQDRERANHLAYRDRSSFEARFLHYDD
jgi:hypothetical protein